MEVGLGAGLLRIRAGDREHGECDEAYRDRVVDDLAALADA